MNNTLIKVNTEDKKYKKLDKMREKHTFKVLKKQLENNMEIQDLNLENELKMQVLENKKIQIEKEKEIREVEKDVNIDDKTILSGKFLKFWSMLVTFISTWLTISGGVDNFSRTVYTKYSYVGAVILLQFTVFIIASQETRIKQHFYQHHWKCVLLKYALLSVSIYNNYQFFKSPDDTEFETAIKIVLCIALDVICIFMIGLAYDQISLNFFENEEYEEKNIILMWLDNKTFNWKNNTKKIYKNNRRTKKKAKDNNKKEDIKENDSSVNNDPVADEEAEKNINNETADNTDNTVISIDKFGQRKYKMFLTYIKNNKTQDEKGYYIPSNSSIISHFKKSNNSTKFYSKDITAAKKICYENRVLIKPEGRKDNTYFTKEFIEKMFKNNNENSEEITN